MSDDEEQFEKFNKLIKQIGENQSIFNKDEDENDKRKDEYIINKRNDNYHHSQINLVPTNIFYDIFNHAKINKKRKGKKKNKKNNKLKKYNNRKGDWLCPFCNNINFSFRTVCNVCGINKSYKEDNQDNQQEKLEIIVQ